MQLRLNTLENSRKSYARVIREYQAGNIEDQQARTLGYLLSGLLSYWRLESDLRVEERLEKIERALEERTKYLEET